MLTPKLNIYNGSRDGKYLEIKSGDDSCQLQKNLFESAMRDYKQGHYEQSFQLFMNLAKQGHAESQVMVGTSFKLGRGVYASEQEAKSWYLKAANQNAGACINLGELCVDSRDFREAKTWFEQGSTLGSGTASARLGDLYRYGAGAAIVMSSETALMYYKLADHQGYPDAHGMIRKLKELIKSEKLINMTSQDKSISLEHEISTSSIPETKTESEVEENQVNLFNELKRQQIFSEKELVGDLKPAMASLDIEQRVEVDKQSVKPLNAEELYQLGLKHAIGTGVERNKKEAERYLKLAVAQNHKDAAMELGSMQWLDMDPLEQPNIALAKDWYAIALKNNHPQALARINEITLYEKSVKEIEVKGLLFNAYSYMSAGKYKAAFKIYEQLADDGNQEAKFHLGVMYVDAEGKYGMREHQKAVKYLESALTEDSNKVAFMLGESHSLAGNMNEAKAWYQKAADAKPQHAEAAFKFAKILVRDAGVFFASAKEKSRIQEYFLLAHQLKHQDAAFELYKNARVLRLSDEEIETSLRMADEVGHKEAEPTLVNILLTQAKKIESGSFSESGKTIDREIAKKIYEKIIALPSGKEEAKIWLDQYEHEANKAEQASKAKEEELSKKQAVDLAEKNSGFSFLNRMWGGIVTQKEPHQFEGHDNL